MTTTLSTHTIIKAILTYPDRTWEELDPEVQKVLSKFFNTRSAKKAQASLNALLAVSNALPPASRCYLSDYSPRKIAYPQQIVKAIGGVKPLPETDNEAVFWLIEFYKKAWWQFEQWLKKNGLQESEPEEDAIAEVLPPMPAALEPQPVEPVMAREQQKPSQDLLTVQPGELVSGRTLIDNKEVVGEFVQVRSSGMVQLNKQGKLAYLVTPASVMRLTEQKPNKPKPAASDEPVWEKHLAPSPDLATIKPGDTITGELTNGTSVTGEYAKVLPGGMVKVVKPGTGATFELLVPSTVKRVATVKENLKKVDELAQIKKGDKLKSLERRATWQLPPIQYKAYSYHLEGNPGDGKSNSQYWYVIHDLFNGDKPILSEETFSQTTPAAQAARAAIDVMCQVLNK